MSARIAWFLAACCLCAPFRSGARADVQRFALIVGNNVGRAPDAPLVYAESDAAKVFGVLRELGGFAPLNMALLEGKDAATVRSTLIELNDRIRASSERGDDSVLFVYYSGHSDVRELHLGGSGLAITELAHLVRGSSATFRLLVLDACRSGALTRVKGGVPRLPFELPRDDRLSGQGLAFLTASAESEDAQEADEIRGSYFTHALVSGLLGAADRNGDGQVVLEEAYRHAYDMTVRATSRSAYGMQHPTFQYDLRGQDGRVLTTLRAHAPERATLTFPEGVSFVVLREDAQGAVLAEVPRQGSARTLSLRAGRYFVRGRGDAYLLEGQVVLAPARAHKLETHELARVAYARLVRKGVPEASMSQALDVGPFVHSVTAGAGTPCVGASLGHVVELTKLSILSRLGVCRSRLDHTFLQGTNMEYDVSAALLHPWDAHRVTFSAGLGVSATLVHQSFETEGRAPARTSIAPGVQLVGTVASELTARTFLRLDVRAGTDFVWLQESAGDAAHVRAEFVARANMSFGVFLR